MHLQAYQGVEDIQRAQGHAVSINMQPGCQDSGPLQTASQIQGSSSVVYTIQNARLGPGSYGTTPACQRNIGPPVSPTTQATVPYIPACGYSQVAESRQGARVPQPPMGTAHPPTQVPSPAVAQTWPAVGTGAGRRGVAWQPNTNITQAGLSQQQLDWSMLSCQQTSNSRNLYTNAAFCPQAVIVNGQSTSNVPSSNVTSNASFHTQAVTNGQSTSNVPSTNIPTNADLHSQVVLTNCQSIPNIHQTNASFRSQSVITNGQSTSNVPSTNVPTNPVLHSQSVFTNGQSIPNIPSTNVPTNAVFRSQAVIVNGQSTSNVPSTNVPTNPVLHSQSVFTKQTSCWMFLPGGTRQPVQQHDGQAAAQSYGHLQVPNPDPRQQCPPVQALLRPVHYSSTVASAQRQTSTERIQHTTRPSGQEMNIKGNEYGGSIRFPKQAPPNIVWCGDRWVLTGTMRNSQNAEVLSHCNQISGWNATVPTSEPTQHPNLNNSTYSPVATSPSVFQPSSPVASASSVCLAPSSNPYGHMVQPGLLPNTRETLSYSSSNPLTSQSNSVDPTKPSLINLPAMTSHANYGHPMISHRNNSHPIISHTTNGVPMTGHSNNGLLVTPHSNNGTPMTSQTKSVDLPSPSLANGHHSTTSKTNGPSLAVSSAHAPIPASDNLPVPRDHAVSRPHDAQQLPSLKLCIKRRKSETGAPEFQIAPVQDQQGNSTSPAGQKLQGKVKRSKVKTTTAQKPAKAPILTSLLLGPNRTEEHGNLKGLSADTEASSHSTQTPKAVAVVSPIAPTSTMSKTRTQHPYADEKGSEEVSALTSNMSGSTATCTTSSTSTPEKENLNKTVSADLTRTPSVSKNTASVIKNKPVDTACLENPKKGTAHLNNAKTIELIKQFSVVTVRKLVAYLEKKEENQQSIEKNSTPFSEPLLMGLFWSGKKSQEVLPKWVGWKSAVFNLWHKDLKEFAPDKYVFTTILPQHLKDLEKQGLIQTIESESNQAEYKSSWRNVNDDFMDISKVLAEENFFDNVYTLQETEQMQNKSQENSKELNSLLAQSPVADASKIVCDDESDNVMEKKQEEGPLPMIQVAFVRPNSPLCHSEHPAIQSEEPVCQTEKINKTEGCEQVPTDETDVRTEVNGSTSNSSSKVHGEESTRSTAGNVFDKMSEIKQESPGGSTNLMKGITLTVLTVDEMESLDLRNDDVIDLCTPPSSPIPSLCSPETSGFLAGRTENMEPPTLDDPQISMKITVLTADELMAVTKSLWNGDQDMSDIELSPSSTCHAAGVAFEEGDDDSICILSQLLGEEPDAFNGVDEVVPLFPTVDEVFLDGEMSMSQTAATPEMPFSESTCPDASWPLKDITQEQFAFDFLQLQPRDPSQGLYPTSQSMKTRSRRRPVQKRSPRRSKSHVLDIQMSKSSPSGIKTSAPMPPSVAVKKKKIRPRSKDKVVAQKKEHVTDACENAVVLASETDSLELFSPDVVIKRPRVSHCNDKDIENTALSNKQRGEPLSNSIVSSSDETSEKPAHTLQNIKSPDGIQNRSYVKLKLFGARKLDPMKSDKEKNYYTVCPRDTPCIIKVMLSSDEDGARVKSLWESSFVSSPVESKQVSDEDAKTADYFNRIKKRLASAGSPKGKWSLQKRRSTKFGQRNRSLSLGDMKREEERRASYPLQQKQGIKFQFKKATEAKSKSQKEITDFFK